MATPQSGLTFDSKKLQKAIEKVPNLLNTSLEFRYTRIGNKFVNDMQDVFTAQPKGKFGGNTTKSKLINRRGNLLGSLRKRVFKKAAPGDTFLRVTIGDAAAPYAKLQELGTRGAGGSLPTIRPKRSKNLAIPLPDNRTAAGRTRFSTRADGMFYIKLNNKKEFLVMRDDDGGLKWMYVLKKKVDVPPRLGFVRRWESKAFQKYAKREVAEGVQKALLKAGLA